MVEDDGGVGRRALGGLETHPTGGADLRAKIFRQARPKIGVDPPSPSGRPCTGQNCRKTGPVCDCMQKIVAPPRVTVDLIRAMR